VRAYLAALHSDDARAAYGLLAPDARKNMSFDQFALEWKQTAAERAWQAKALEESLKGNPDVGERALVSFSDGKLVQLEREGKTWRLESELVSRSRAKRPPQAAVASQPVVPSEVRQGRRHRQFSGRARAIEAQGILGGGRGKLPKRPALGAVAPVRCGRAGIAEQAPGIRMIGRQPRRLAIKADGLVLRLARVLVPQQAPLLHHRLHVGWHVVAGGKRHFHAREAEPRGDKPSCNQSAPRDPGSCRGLPAVALFGQGRMPIVRSRHPGVELVAEGVDARSFAAGKLVHGERTRRGPAHRRRAVAAKITGNRLPPVQAAAGADDGVLVQSPVPRGRSSEPAIPELFLRA